MSKEYVFKYSGTRERFLNNLSRFYSSNYYDGKYYYFNDYIVKLIGDEIHFGVERAGHSGGYWFIPVITEYDDRIEFCGEVRYIGPEDDQSKFRKAFDNVGLFLLFVLILPIYLIMQLYVFIEWIVRKVCNRTKPKAKTTEDKLFDLMENHLHCIRK